MKNKNNHWFLDSDDYFFGLNEMRIKNKRSKFNDYAFLKNDNWSGILQGTDGYPNKVDYFKSYCIGGGKEHHFTATSIEFYGIKTKQKHYYDSFS